MNIYLPARTPRTRYVASRLPSSLAHRGIVLLLLLVWGTETTRAQVATPASEPLVQEMDSLTALRGHLERHLEQVNERLKALQMELRKQEVLQHEDARVVLVTNMEASIRARPEPSAPIVSTVPAGTPLAALDYDGAYWHVRLDGREGWVMRFFVDEGDGADTLKAQLLSERSDREPADPEAVPVQPAGLTAPAAPLRVTAFGVRPPDSAGGVAVYYRFANLDSTRAIRSISFSFTPFDAQGAAQTGRNSGVSTRRLRRFGPIAAADGERSYEVENVWYNDAIRCVRLDRVDVVYADGSSYVYTRDLPDLLGLDVPNACAAGVAGRL